MRNDEPLISWPKEGPTRAPYQVMHDPDIYRLEMERIFRGPTWHYLCLDVEIPNPGDYKTTFIGETPIIVVRDQDGSINALVNRCAHKGAMLCIDPCGTRKEFACVYHAWTYDLKGNLTSIAFQRGLAGAGGMPADFDMKKRGLKRVRVENFCGMVFGTFSDTVEDVETYLGPEMAAHVRRIFNRPIEVIGYSHQVLPNNWKLYMENSRDPYHATILHAFYATFKLNRLSMLGGVSLGHNGWHNLLYSAAARDIQKDNYQGKGLRSVIEDVGLPTARSSPGCRNSTTASRSPFNRSSRPATPSRSTTPWPSVRPCRSASTAPSCTSPASAIRTTTPSCGACARSRPI